MKLLFNLFILYKSCMALALRFGLRDFEQSMNYGADGLPVTVAEHLPSELETGLAGLGALYALKEILE